MSRTIIFNYTAEEDFDEIRDYLQNELGKSDTEAQAYIKEMKSAFKYEIVEIGKIIRTKASKAVHKEYGEYIARYRRNKTTWYACYDMLSKVALVNKIVSNYITIRGI